MIHKEKYDFNYALKTYLFTIAKSKSLNYLKREKRIVQINENDVYDLQELEEKVFLNERRSFADAQDDKQRMQDKKAVILRSAATKNPVPSATICGILRFANIRDSWRLAA